MREKKIIKICFVCPKAYPLFNPSVKEVFGGAELDLYTLACELAGDFCYEVSFITADYGQDSIENVNGVTIYKGIDFRKNSFTGAKQIWRAMQQADSDIYVQETAGWGTFLVALFCSRHKRKFIYRTASERECNGVFLSEKWVAGKAFAWALKHSAEVIVQNKRDKLLLSKTIGVDSVVIRNAQHLPENIEISDRQYVLWVGRSISVKRPYLFLKLAEQCKDINFVMVCQKATGDNNYGQLVSKAESVKNLKFIPRVPSSEINKYFQSAIVFVNTSESEGFPNTFIEACKWSVPILSLNVNPDGFLQEFNCGLCADNDWEIFISKLKLMIVPEQQKEYGTNARSYAERFHDISRVINDYKLLFEKLKSR